MVKKSERLHIPITAELKLKLEDIANKQDISLSDLVRKVLKKYVENLEKKE